LVYLMFTHPPSDVLRGDIQFTNFPSEEGVIPKSQKIEVSNLIPTQTMEITTLKWSSDGYVLAVGWKHGWGIFTVSGKCIASGFGVNDTIDRDRWACLAFLQVYPKN